MLHAETLSTIVDSAAPAALFHPPVEADVSAPVAPRVIEPGFRSVEMDGRNLWHDPQEVVVGQLAEAIRLADLRGKQEININNIAPWIEVGQSETGQVPIIQDKIQQHLAAACQKVQRPMPECRLDLNRGEFGIRCYLGRMKPTDFVYEEDLISDSR